MSLLQIDRTMFVWTSNRLCIIMSHDQTKTFTQHLMRTEEMDQVEHVSCTLTINVCASAPYSWPLQSDKCKQKRQTTNRFKLELTRWFDDIVWLSCRFDHDRATHDCLFDQHFMQHFAFLVVCISDCSDVMHMCIRYKLYDGLAAVVQSAWSNDSLQIVRKNCAFQFSHLRTWLLLRDLISDMQMKAR